MVLAIISGRLTLSACVTLSPRNRTAEDDIAGVTTREPLVIAQVNHDFFFVQAYTVLKPTHSLCVKYISVCVFCDDNAIMGSVSGMKAAVDNTQASWSYCLSIRRLAGGWLNAI